jgi:hypothetical protein
VKANDPDYVLPPFWTNLQKRLVGKAQGEWPLVKGKKTRVRVARIGKKLTLLNDGAPMWEGEDVDYTEGSVLFYADSRARIDNVTITFKP